MNKKSDSQIDAESNQEASALNFEQAFEKLESLVSRMEQGDQTLEQSLSDFENGVKLIKRCQQQLAQAEQKVTQLMQDTNGNTVEQPFAASTSTDNS